MMQASDIVWASRWDTYLAMSDVQIHWFAIVNSVVIVLFLSGKSVYSFTWNHLTFPGTLVNTPTPCFWDS